MRKKINVLLLSVCFFVGGFICFPVEAADFDQASAAAQELLEYSLKGVKARMKEVSEDNNALILRNSALRGRILSLQKYTAELENQKISLLEEFIEMRDVVKEQKEESVWVAAREKRLKGKRQRLSREQRHLEMQVQEDVQRRDDLQERVGINEKILRVIQKDTRGPDIADIKRKFQQQKKDVDKELKEYKRRAQEVLNEKLQLERQRSVSLEKRNEAKKVRKALQQELSQNQQALKEKVYQEDELKEEVQEKKLAMSQQRQAVYEETAELNVYKERITALVEKLGEAGDAVVRGFSQDKRQIDELRRLLEKEGSCLVKQKEVVEEKAGWHKRIKQEKKKEIERVSKTKEKKGHVVSLEAKKVSLREDALAKEEAAQKLEQEMRDVREELGQLSQHMAKQAGVGRRGSKRELEKVKKEVSLEVREYDRKIRKSEKHKNILKQDFVKIKAELSRVDGERIALKEKLASLKDVPIGQVVQEMIEMELAQVRRKTFEPLKEKVAELKKYKIKIKEMIDSLKKARDSIVREFSKERQRILNLKRLLYKEEPLLVKKSAVIAQTHGWQKKIQRTFQEKDTYEEKNLSRKDQIDSLMIEKKVLQDSLAYKKQEQQKLQKELDEAREDVGQVERKTQEDKDQGRLDLQRQVKAGKRELTEMINSYHQKIQRSQKTKDRLVKENKEAAMKVEQLTPKRNSLKSEVSLKEAKLKKLVVEGESIRQKKEALKQGQQQDGGPINKEIEILKVRQEVLSNSLDVIESRYYTIQGGVVKASGEARQLTEYFSVLQQENKRLERKVSTLKLALKTLQEKKEGL